ncbi:hypothetical protein FHS20_001194 [Phyllobacterium endophyticum]|jgi:hypothetical protein|nr:hypothetical protein [Phyllobacterium endophyticum]
MPQLANPLHVLRVICTYYVLVTIFLNCGDQEVSRLREGLNV